MLTSKELSELYNKVSSAVWDYNIDYHTSYTCGNDEWNSDYTYVSFEVYGYNDKTGNSWTEYWGIDSDGKIHTADRTYDSFDAFLSDWR